MSSSRNFAFLVSPLLALVTATTVDAQELDGLQPSVSARVGSVTYGPYARFEAGSFISGLDDAYWLPPGAGDPQVNFDLDGDNTGFAGIALGYDWQNGFRGDIALLSSGDVGFSGPCSSASDGSSCTGTPHADITDGSLSTTALMANVFYSPLEQRGSNSVFQPFIVAGLGVARNDVGSWTRTNAASPERVRVFSSNQSSDLAWSLGFGAAWQITDAGEYPIILEVAWRYYDFGTAEGGSVADVGTGTPRQALTFDNRNQVISFGVRIPLERY
jgi:opacity protein-like surface antigen